MTRALTYREFLVEKVNLTRAFGFPIDDSDINPALKPHQRAIVTWAIAGGRRAIFAAFGLGKGCIQLEISRLILARESGKGLIICPLGVRQEFTRDATELLGMSAPRFIRRSEEIDGDGLYLTNYESVRDGKLNPSLFTAVSLDEASVLRSYGSLTYQTFLTIFKDVKYRFVATATPSPNRHKELIHYAAFLGIMDSAAALTRWFQRDSTKANNLTLYPHKETEFYLWLNTWACFLNRPSDLGFPDSGYDLPPLEIIYHEVEVDHSTAPADRNGQAHLFRSTTLGVSAAAREKRETLPARIKKMTEIVNGSPGDHFVLWHDLEDERRAITAALPDAIEVYGSLDLDTREKRVIDFSNGKIRLLASKPEISGSGCNFQRHCHRAIFVGIGFQFNDFWQACHRIHRFMQPEQVRIHIIHAESEREVVRTLQRKWKQHEELTETMTGVIREHGLNPDSITRALARTIGVERIKESGNGWQATRNDCVLETQEMDRNSVDLIVTSIPFSNHYEYTPAVEDFGHTDNNDHFWAQMDYLTPQLLRVLRPGRIYACHVKDRILFGSVTGAGIPTVSPFHAEAIMHGRKHAFDYIGMITVVTDVVRENNQTYRLGWTENSKDSTKMGVGSPEFVLLFHKPQTDRSKGYADVPVTKSKTDYTRARWQTDAHAYWRSNGDRHLTPDELTALPADHMSRLFTEQSLRQIYDYEAHIELGEALEARGSLPATFMALAPGSHHPDVWHDVNRMLTLNTEQSRRAQANHVCPLQFQIVDRLITRYTNPGEIVLDPFAGLMTVPLRATKLGREGRGVELNLDYFRDGVAYLRAEERKIHMPSLFDLAGLSEVVS